MAWIELEPPERSTIVVRELADGEEHRIPLGDGLLMHVRLDASEEWIVASLVDKDTDLDGKLMRATQPTSLPAAGCRGPVASFSSMGRTGDQPTLYTAPASGTGALREASDLPALGPVRLLHDEQGAVLLQAPDGPARAVAAAEHAARVAGGSFVLGRAVLVATRGETPGRAWIVGAGESVPLAERLVAPRENVGIWSERLLPVQLAATEPATSGAMGVVDLQSGTVTVVGVKVGSVWEGRVLVWRDAAWMLVDIDAGTERVLATGVEALPDADWAGDGLLRGETNGPWAALDGWLIDLAAGRVGRYEGEACALDRSGRVLVATQPYKLRSSLDVGPMRWLAVPDDMP
jgi:hypothetical protein